nr:MAG TPA: hypothetical protein [Caudoviricetes sp.]
MFCFSLLNFINVVFSVFLIGQKAPPCFYGFILIFRFYNFYN